MKTSFWILLGISACSGLVLPAHVAPDPKECIPPPTGAVINDIPGELMVCQKGTEALCCAYGFLPSHQDICYHVLCQSLDCFQPWEYIKTVCPPAPTEEESVSCPAPSNEYLLNARPLKG